MPEDMEESLEMKRKCQNMRSFLPVQLRYDLASVPLDSKTWISFTEQDYLNLYCSQVHLAELYLN